MLRKNVLDVDPEAGGSLVPKGYNVPFAIPEKQRQCLACLQQNNSPNRTFLTNMQTI